MTVAFNVKQLSIFITQPIPKLIIGGRRHKSAMTFRAIVIDFILSSCEYPYKLKKEKRKNESEILKLLRIKIAFRGTATYYDMSSYRSLFQRLLHDLLVLCSEKQFKKCVLDNGLSLIISHVNGTEPHLFPSVISGLCFLYFWWKNEH